MGRLGNYKEEIETPMSEQEKTDFVSGKFLYAITDFSLFKRGETYWLEYIGNDTYCCRSDNLLNVKIKTVLFGRAVTSIREYLIRVRISR